ncbi:hypothetical protein ASE26_11060 [Duganella sp. Root198D2]|nr:hypothetical protein ASE26_11060 [Duganella sp. Root198D2]
MALSGRNLDLVLNSSGFFAGWMLTVMTFPCFFFPLQILLFRSFGLPWQKRIFVHWVKWVAWLAIGNNNLHLVLVIKMHMDIAHSSSVLRDVEFNLL